MKNLRYLFTAELSDGSIYKQNSNDASIKNPPVIDASGELQGKSCMFDLQEDVDNFQVKRFHLVEQKFIGGHIYTVDLADGHFEIDGVSFEVQGDRPLPVSNPQFKLIYFRSVQQDIIYNYNPDGSIKNTVQGDKRIVYVLGCQTTVVGKNYQQMILIK